MKNTIVLQKFAIHATHSRWGTFTLEARKEMVSTTVGAEQDSTCDQNIFYNFYYLSGRFMGGFDSERGGGLWHPNENVAVFMELYDQDLYITDRSGYLELENLIEEQIRIKDPEFFSKELPWPRVDSRAKQIYVEFKATAPDGKLCHFILSRTPNGYWLPASTFHAAHAVEVSALRMMGFELSDYGFESCLSLRTQLEEKGYTNLTPFSLNK